MVSGGASQKGGIFWVPGCGATKENDLLSGIRWGTPVLRTAQSAEPGSCGIYAACR